MLIEVRPDGRGQLAWPSWFRACGAARSTLDGCQYHDSYLTALDAMVGGEGIGLAIPQLAQQHLDLGLLVPVSETCVSSGAGYHLLHERANARGAEIADRLASLAVQFPQSDHP